MGLRYVSGVCAVDQVGYDVDVAARRFRVWTLQVGAIHNFLGDWMWSSPGFDFGSLRWNFSNNCEMGSAAGLDLDATLKTKPSR